MRTVLVGLAGLLLVLTSGCAVPDLLDDGTAGASTAVDAARAQRVWADPWATPDEATVAGPQYGSNGLLDRTVGTRTSVRSGAANVVLPTELALAEDAGWTTVAAWCPTPGDTGAVLVRGDDLDTAAVSVVTVRAASGGTAEVEVRTAVPHHADTTWPLLDASAVAPACGDAAAGYRADSDAQDVREVADDLLTGAPVEGGGDAGGDAAWERDEPTAAETALADTVGADPWVTGLVKARSVGYLSPELEAGERRRTAPSTTLETQVPDGATPVQAVAAEITDALNAGGWSLTWTSCRTDGSAAATLALPTADGPAVARVGAGTDGQLVSRVTLPVAEGPDPGWVVEVPSLDDLGCLDEAVPADATTGTPVALPDVLTPYAG